MRIKLNAEIQDPPNRRVVGERSISNEAYTVRWSGVDGSENAGMSSESPMRIRATGNPRFPTQRSSTWGESGPKPSPPTGGVGDGQQIDISVLRSSRYQLGIDGVGIIEPADDLAGLSTKIVLTGKSVRMFN